MPPVRQWRDPAAAGAEAFADSAAARRLVVRHFPAAARLAEGPDRRRFLRLMAASLVLAGLTGCDDGDGQDADGRNEEVPYVRAPAGAPPGASLTYASIAVQDGLANGITVTTRDGRPLKIEGNAQHPWSRGGTDAFGQASILALYDPGRSQTVRRGGRISDWDSLARALTDPIDTLRDGGGQGFALLTGPLSSPSMLAQITALRAAMPAMGWYTHAAVDRGGTAEGARLAYGRVLDTQYRLDRARVIVALDGDLLDPGPRMVGQARAWADARRAAGTGAAPVLYAAASIPGLTSARADHPVAATPAEIMALAEALAEDVARPDAPAPAAPGDTLGVWRTRAAGALRGARGAGLVTTGAWSPPALHAAVHRLNDALGNTGHTVVHTAPACADGAPIGDLIAAMARGEVTTLLMLGVNPVYDAPGFAPVLHRVALKLHAGLYEDETGLRADWHMPLAHPLESWGDARSPDGTVGLMQPTVEPLYGGRSAAEILSLLFDDTPRPADVLLRAHWQGDADEAAFAPQWRDWLRDGFVPGHALPVETVTAGPAPAPPAPMPAPTTGAGGVTVVFRPDPTVWDGSLGGNAWLQELAKPLTKLVWQNAVTLAPAFAARLGVTTGDVVALVHAGRRIEAPVWIMPGQADGVAGLTLGYGRAVPGHLADGLGYDANALRGAASVWQLDGVRIMPTGRRAALVTTQTHGTMEGHDFVRVQHAGAPPVGDPAPAARAPSLYAETRGDGRAWGMVIDLDACIGCNACVTACQAENNIAVVGAEQVALGRDMQWLRVDRYYEGPAAAPATRFQPVPCMQCEDAPCEVGCPVEATLHDQEGLNLMVYNRCVGTRACSGYCPYKVRRFNWLDYSAGAAPSLALQRNPEVTVRARGVMEKCTFCVQRIEAARIEADRTDRPIADGAVRTACQGACPTQAISFGDLHDPAAAVAAARRDPRHYALLGELGTRPRTTYLAVRAPAEEDGGT